jgi:hypothetical protein
MDSEWIAVELETAPLSGPGEDGTQGRRRGDLSWDGGMGLG